MSIINEQLIALVEGAKRKDTRAIEFLYNEFYGEVYYTCYKILGSQEDAKDIAQDTFLEAFIGIDNLNQPLSFKFWINRIATNKSFNFLKRYNRISVNSQETIEQLSQVEDIEANPENIVIESDVRYTIENIMEHLPEEQRRTLFLFYYQDMTVREIAELYQCSESTVRSRLAYARKFMRREVEKLEDNGYKLRCLTALPFIFALFNAEKSTTTIIGQGNIIAALNSYISSIPTANSNVINNAINMSNQPLQQNVQQTIQKPNTINKYKASAISKTAKITIAIVSTVVVVGAVALTGLLINNNKNKIPTEQDAVSTIVDNNSSQSNSNIDTESQVPQTSSEPEEQIDTYIKWQFRDVEAPTFEDAKYTEIKPYKDFEEFSENQREKTEILATPSYYIDMDKAKEFIKNNELINNEFELAEAGEEYQNFFNSDIMGMQFKYNVYDIIYGYKPGTKEKELFYFKSNQKYNLYNTPNSYSLSITTEKMSQDDIYNIVKEIFGENIAEWAVYAKSDKEIKKESYSYDVVVTTPNGKGKYRISRSIIRKGENKPYEFSIGIYFDDESTTLRDTYNSYEHYSNGYVPFDMDIPLSSLFDVDVGDTDISKPKEFFNKLLDSTGENEYIYTVLTSASKKYIKFADGSIYNSYNIEGSQGVKRPNQKEVVYYGADDLRLSVAATCDKDGNITDISEFAIVIPTGRLASSDYTNEVKVEKLIDLSIKKASELLNIPINELKESMSLILDNPYIYYKTDKKEINLFGKTINGTISFIVYSDSIGEIKIEI